MRVYKLRDALGIAAGLHEYFRQSDLIQMAHCAQTVNVIGCITTTKTVDKEQVAIREEASVPFAGSVTVPPYSVSVYRVAIAGDSAP